MEEWSITSPFLTSVLDGRVSFMSRPLYHGEIAPGTHYVYKKGNNHKKNNNGTDRLKIFRT
jgi:hypothetical protein